MPTRSWSSTRDASPNTAHTQLLERGGRYAALWRNHERAVGDPRSEVTAVFTAIHDALRQDHWATQLIVGEKLAGPSILPAIERIYAALRAAGLGPRDTAVAYALLWHYTAGELLDRHHVTPDSYSQRMVRAADPDAYPHLTESANAFPPGPAGDWFTESFRRILDGLLITSRR